MFFKLRNWLFSFHDVAFCTFAWVSQCASTVSVPHLIPRTVFPLTPSRPPRTVLNGVHHTISLDTEYCFWLYLGFNECYGACFEIVILLSAYCSSFPLPFHLPGLELASFVWIFVSTLDWLSLFFCVVLFWSLLRFTFVLLSGIDWSWPVRFSWFSWPVRFASFLCGIFRTHTCFLFWIRAPELASLFPQLVWFYNGHIFIPSCFASRFRDYFGRFRSRWAELYNFLCECVLNNLPLPLLQWCFCSCFLLVGSGSLWRKDEFLRGFYFGFPFWGAVSYFWFHRKRVLGLSVLSWIICLDECLSIIYRPCSNGASVPVSSPIIDALSVSRLALFWLLILGFLRKEKDEFLIGFFVASFRLCPFLVYCLGPLCVCLIASIISVSWTFLCWALLSLSPIINVGSFCAGLNATNWSLLTNFSSTIDRLLLQWCLSACFYSNNRCLYLSWFLLGFLWSPFGCAFSFFVLSIASFVFVVDVFFSWGWLSVSNPLCLSHPSWMCLGTFCFLSNVSFRIRRSRYKCLGSSCFFLVRLSSYRSNPS